MSTWKRFAILVLAIAGVWGLASWLIVTDAERIEGVLDAALEGLGAKDAAKALSAVAEDFSQDGIDRASLVEGVQGTLTRYPPRSLEWINRQIEPKGDAATARVWLRYFPAPESILPYPVDTEWELSLAKRAGQWRIVRIEPIAIGGQPMGSLASVLQQAR